MKKFLCRIFITLFTLSISSQAFPANGLITIDTTSLRGMAAEIALDFIDGGMPANSVTVSGFLTDGTTGAYSQVGSVSGSLANSLVFSDGGFFSEHVQSATLGTRISFLIEDSGRGPAGSAFPDSFSLFLLDDHGASLVTSNDPSGANALLNLGLGMSSLPNVYSGPGFSVSISAVPEASSITLLSAGLALVGAVFHARRRP